MKLPLKAAFLVLRGAYLLCVLSVIALEMCLDRIDCAIGDKSEPEITDPQTTYGAPRPWLSVHLPALARLLHAARQGFGIYWSHSFFNRKLCRPSK